MAALGLDHETAVGIDLGTTFSAIAYVDEDGSPRIIEVDGESTLPSAVLFHEDGAIEVGKKAVRQALVKSDRVVQWIKLSMGEAFSRLIGDKEYTPPEISAIILQKLVSDAQAVLGVPIRRAIITCPAWFTDRPRKATAEAGRLAGLEVLDIVNEPTAAAVYYGLEKLDDGDTLLVYDLGGGTFDCSVIQYKNGELEHLTSEGDRKLGGHNWTEVLVEKVAEKFEAQFGENPTLDPVVGQQLYERCEEVKRDFRHIDRQIVACTYKGRGADVEVTRAEFEEWTEHLLQPTLFHVERAVQKIKKNWADISHVLLVGGSTRLRRVSEALAELTGKQPIETGREDTMVALGAAAMTAKQVRVGHGRRSVLKPVKIKERTPFALAMVTMDASTSGGFKSAVIIPDGVEVPAQGTRADLKTVVSDQHVFDVPVVELHRDTADEDLEGKDPRMGALNLTYRFQCAASTPVGSPIEVTFSYSKNRQIGVSAKDVRSGTELPCEPIEFQYPQGGGSRTVDVCFVVDCTGSMGGCIMGVKQEIGNFCNQLAESSFNWRLGLVEFRDEKIGEPTIPHGWTTDVAGFRETVSRLTAHGGGDEPESALDALAVAAGTEWRPDAGRVAVLVTDASCHEPDQSGRSADAVAGLLEQAGVKAFAIAPETKAYQTIVDRTGGRLFDFKSRFVVGAVDLPLFREVLSDLGRAVIDTLLTT